MKLSRSLPISGLILSLLAGGSAIAQDGRLVPGPAMPCPFPVMMTLYSEGPATPDAADFRADMLSQLSASQFGQTQLNKHFGTTLKFKLDDCCAMSTGVLKVHVKALQSGPANSATSANDQVALVSNHGAVTMSQSPWAGGATAGAQAVVTFNVPASVLATGQVSVFVQDETAVGRVELTMNGCCIKR